MTGSENKDNTIVSPNEELPTMVDVPIEVEEPVPSPEVLSEQSPTYEFESVSEEESMSGEKPEEKGHETEEIVRPKETKPVEEIAIPNPMCEVEYHYPLRDLIGEEAVISVVASDDNGLVYDADTKALVGKPAFSHNYWMELELRERVIRFKCFVNENPRLLWKDIPSDQVVKPDKDYRAFLSPRLDIIAVSHRGRMHANRGTYRDDDFFIGTIGKFSLSIVADGAGSAPLSSTGSKVFCAEAGFKFTELVEAKQKEFLAILSDLQFHPDDAIRDSKLMTCLYEILPASALYGRKVLMQMAEDNQVPLKHYHTTALFSLTAEIEPNSYFCAAFQIGDGITTALVENKLYLLGVADAGSFPGETVFVTSNGVFDDASSLLKRIHCLFCKDKPTLISMTDGIADSYFKDCPHLDNLPKWQQLVADITNEKGVLMPPSEICDWLNYYVDQEHDDRTMSVTMYK